MLAWARVKAATNVQFCADEHSLPRMDALACQRQIMEGNRMWLKNWLLGPQRRASDIATNREEMLAIMRREQLNPHYGRRTIDVRDHHKSLASATEVVLQ